MGYSHFMLKDVSTFILLDPKIKILTCKMWWLIYSHFGNIYIVLYNKYLDKVNSRKTKYNSKRDMNFYNVINCILILIYFYNI